MSKPKIIELVNRRIGPGEPVFITMEAGPTHDGVESAKRLITMAADAKADAVKFQIFDPDRLVADKKQLFEYEVLIDKETGQREKISEPLYDILMRRHLRPDEWREVKAHADEAGIAFFATVGFEDDIALLTEIGCDSIKIASGDINHLPLIGMAAETGMIIQIDTGNATIGEVECAIDAILAKGNDKIVIHHCPSGYPAHLESINLNVIPTLARMFGLPVAFSDHTPGWDMDIAAVALGANMIEKTITEDRLTRSVEHIMSLDPENARDFMTAMREMEIALGTTRRIMSPEERKSGLAVRRSAFLRTDLPAGHVLCKEDIEYRRPGHGIAPDLEAQIIGRTLASDRSAGDRLDFSDFAT